VELITDAGSGFSGKIEVIHPIFEGDGKFLDVDFV
jgi:hypothetical protein